jgi:predicted nucleic acid-binding protein
VEVTPARVVLDTSAYSRFQSRHAGIVAALAEAKIILMPVTVLGELEAGFELGMRSAANRQELARFLADPAVAVLDTTSAVARRWARIFARLRRAGTPVSANDMWIAAAAMECGGHLLTFDSDFAKIPGLEHTLLSA